MDWNLSVMLMIVAFGFIASFVDSIVGGGGLISTPALLAVGLPPSAVLGTSKFTSSFSTLTSTLKFLRSGKVDLKIVGKMFLLIFVVPGGGAIIATYIPANISKPLIIIALSLALTYTVIQKDWGNIRTLTDFTFTKAVLFTLIFIVVGFYDRFLGGGTGSFMLFTLLLFGFDLLSVAGNAKVLNFVSSCGVSLFFTISGQVNYFYGAIMTSSMMIGALLDAQFALKEGVGYVKALFLVVTAILITKDFYDSIVQ